MFVFKRVMIKTNSSVSPMKHLEFSRSPKQALPNIDWNNEDHVSSQTAHKLRLYLKQHNLQVSRGKATLVASVLRYVRAAQQILEPEDNDATSDSELQASDSELIQTTQKTMHNQTLQKWATLSNTIMRYSLSQTLMSNASHYIAKDSGIFTIFVGGGWRNVMTF